MTFTLSGCRRRRCRATSSSHRSRRSTPSSRCRESARASPSRRRSGYVDRGVGRDHERARTTPRSPGCRSGQEYRDLIKLIPGVHVHAGLGARPELRRERPGQRLQLRRRQRDAAALRHAVGGALVARHRAVHGRQGRRARRSTSTAPAASTSTRSASPAPTASPARSSTASSRHGMSGEARPTAAPRATTQNRDWTDRQRRRPDGPEGPGVLLRLVLPADAEPPQPRPTPTASCPNYDSVRNEGFGKVTVTPTLVDRWSTPATATRTRLDTGSLFGSAHGGDGRHAAASRGRRSARVDGSWVINANELPELQVHPLREPGPHGVPTTSRPRCPTSHARHASRHRQPRQAWGCSSVPKIGSNCRGQHVHHAADQPVRLRRTPNTGAQAPAAAPSAIGSDVRQRRLLPRRRTDRLQPTR